MTTDPNPVQELVDMVERDCPGLRGLGSEVADLITMTISGATGNLKGLEQMMSAEGITTPIAVAIMVLSAQASFYQGLPADNPLRQLFEAGTTIGVFIVKQKAAMVVARERGSH